MTVETGTVFAWIGIVITVTGSIVGVLWSLRSAVVKLSVTLDNIQRHTERQTSLLDELFNRTDRHETDIAVLKERCTKGDK